MHRGLLNVSLISVFLLMSASVVAAELFTQERMFERTFESSKKYDDPFNDVDVDVIFSRGAESWRVPAFWSGGQRWTVRFAPPLPGDYEFRLQSTDLSNPDLNDHPGRVRITPYVGPNVLMRHGMLRVSPSRRYFEHADGTPFFWLGDTWWTGLSDRLSWEGFKKLTTDRASKGFTVVQLVAGLVPSEELAPLDPGFHNEGGFVWEKDFARINPKYFDYADRRIQNLLEAGIVPALVGAWSNVLDEMGAAKVKKHWRYLVGRYGAYPMFWIAGGEVLDPPLDAIPKLKGGEDLKSLGGWTDVVRYIRDTDPYHHPLSVHEYFLVSDTYPVQDESLMDFDCLHPSHFGWPSVATAVVQLDMHYARTTVRKPIVQCEIGYEGLGGYHLQDYQRAAFWLTMLNGAAGHTYGAVGTWEAYTADKPFQRVRWSLTTWDEGMQLPGSYQIGIGAKLLRRFPWWKFQPHPEWVAPRGVTMLEPHAEVSGFGADLDYGKLSDVVGRSETDTDTVFAPYAAGIPDEVRIIYSPSFGFAPLDRRPLVTVLGLEVGIRYAAWFWDPQNGTKIDLGSVERPNPGAVIRTDDIAKVGGAAWVHRGETLVKDGALVACGAAVSELTTVREKNLVASVTIGDTNTDGSLILRFQDESNYISAVYSSHERRIYVLERKAGVDGAPLGLTKVGPLVGEVVRITAEVSGLVAIVALTDGRRTYTSPIVDVSLAMAGTVGVAHKSTQGAQRFSRLEVRRNSAQILRDPLQEKLYDAAGRYRGEIDAALNSRPATRGEGISAWTQSVKHNHVLLDAYRPDRLPYPGDWLLVLENVDDVREH